jgi:hypothetical protein
MCDKLVYYKEGDVIIIKNAKVSDYQGRSLNLSEEQT